MSTIPISPGSPADRSTSCDPIVLDSVVVRDVRLEHAAAGAPAEPITFLAAVELQGDLSISPLRVTLAEPTRIAIDWPEPLLVRGADGEERVATLSGRARQAVHDALVRHLLHGDLGEILP